MRTRRRKDSPFRVWKKRQAYRLLPMFPPIGKLLIRGIGASLRSRFTGHTEVLKMVESGQPFVLALYHGRQFLIVHELQGWPLAIMTSVSYMGDIQSRILDNFGYTTFKGSSSRGGAVALARVTRLVRKGLIGAFAVDGPRGPYKEVKPGAVFVAKKLGVPLVPVSTSAWPSLVFENAWDRYLLPLPFSRALVHFGEPMFLDGDISETSIEQDSQRLRRTLEDLEVEADALIGRTRQ
jgi:lysophospholipid acyltransferase (LPLAT)-like uncharacterized protein